jgi:hypothetical protein
LPLLFGVLLGLGLAAPAWLALLDYVHGSARAAQDSAEHFQWRVPVGALPGFIIPNWTVNWADFSSRLMPHTATELACGLVPPVVLIAGLVILRRALFRRIGWELGLLLVALILSMLPTANVFRWSFRWLPLVHLVLALCAAETLQLFWQSGARFARSWSPAIVTFAALLTTYLWIPPNCGVPKYNLAPELTQPAPLDPQRLYLSVYPAPEDAYRLEKHAEPFGPTVRPGSTSMWGGVRLLNGYSPILPSGVAREFAFAIHGEIRPDVANSLLEREAGADGLLARIGVDGIIVASEVATIPQPETEWELAVTTKEGRVFHRRSGPFSAVRTVTAIDSRPNEQFTPAEISRIDNRRNRLEANVTVPPNGHSALLTFSRPFFRGYQAWIGDRSLKVDSHRGLVPSIEIPAGTSGRLTLVYRPSWLIWGGGVSILCLGVAAVCGVLAISGMRRS